MTFSKNPTEVEPLNFDEPSFLLDSNNTGNTDSAARSFNFNPIAPGANLGVEPQPIITPPPPVNTEEEDPQAITGPLPEFNLLRELQKATQTPDPDGTPPVSKQELAALLESFACVLRGDAPNGGAALADKTAEIGQLKELLLEAQETIIGLLNDRVFDRAKIAKLDAEVRLLPDLQSQANRAMGLASRSEDVQEELVQVKAEVERLRTSYMRSDHGFLARLFGKR